MPRTACGVSILAIVGVLASLAAVDSRAQDTVPSSGTREAALAPMPETVRTAVGRVVVIAGRRPASQDVGGTYARDTPGLIGGMSEGAELGRIRKQVGPVPVTIPIPILQIPGAIFGGLSGATRRQIQEFRDALTEELASAENDAIRDDGLALDVFWGLRKLPQLDSKLYSPTTAVPDDTDAVLYVTFNDIGIDVRGKEAIVSTVAEATLRRYSDAADLYETTIRYRDRDTLRNWTANDNALWRDYANFARHYLGRELAADIFGRVELRHDLEPKETETASLEGGEWRFISRSTAPTLAWELALADDPGAPWAKRIDEADIDYDVEIYDAHQVIYWEERVPEPRHTLAVPLECGTYRWSVRPAYRVDGAIRFGEWMRRHREDDGDTGVEAELEPALEPGPGATSKAPPKPVKGLVGREASAAPAYTQDFASLEIECGR